MNGSNCKLQLNFKYDQTLINLYANSPAELDAELGALADRLSRIMGITDQLKAGQRTSQPTVSEPTTVEQAQAVVEQVFAGTQTVADSWGAQQQPIAPPVQQAPPAPTTQQGTMQCQDCGGPAEFKSGISQKSGKPYKGIYCQMNKAHVKWL